MSGAKYNLAVRLLPSLTDAAFLMPAAFLFCRMSGAATLLSDGDTGWHIRTGDWILQNGRVPERDIFSFTRPGEPWFAWEWLWDVVFAWLHRQWGMAAVVLASLLILCLTFALLFRLTRRKCGNDFLAISVTFLATAGSSLHWLARPHLITLLFVVITYSVLERARDGERRWLLSLPLLAVLWTNLHGGFLAGIILVFAYGAGELAAWLVEAEEEQRRAALTRSRPYFLTGAGCILATFINPYTYRLHAHIYAYITESYHLKNISEFLSTNFQSPIAVFYELMLLLGAIAAFRSAARKEFTYTILFLIWAHFALFSRRHVPILMIVAAPFVALRLRELLDEVRGAAVARWISRGSAAFASFAAEFSAIDRLPRFYLPSVAASLLFAVLFLGPRPPASFRSEYDPKRYPARALEAICASGPCDGVFTDDEWGDYVIYRLYPSAKVFIDGRSDFYGGTFGREFLDIWHVRHNWEKKLEAYGVDTVLLPVEVAMAGALKESQRWRPVYDDGVAIVFRPVQALAAGREKTNSIVIHINGTGSDLRSKRPETLTQTNTNPVRRRTT